LLAKAGFSGRVTPVKKVDAKKMRRRVSVFIQTRLRVGTEKQRNRVLWAERAGEVAEHTKKHKGTSHTHSKAYLVGTTLIATLLLITLFILFTTQIVE
jgi:hypothetical protein